MRPEELIEFLLTRRSIRKYRPDPVPLEIIRKVLDVARFAPSARNQQPWIFIVVTDKELKDKLASIYPWRQPIADAPAGIAVACDKEASPNSYEQDCSAVALYIMFAAHALGLGTCWHALYAGDEKRRRVKELLGLPDKYEPVVLLSIGWPAESPQPRPRKPLSEIAFVNFYGNRI